MYRKFARISVKLREMRSMTRASRNRRLSHPRFVCCECQLKMRRAWLPIWSLLAYLFGPRRCRRLMKQSNCLRGDNNMPKTRYAVRFSYAVTDYSSSQKKMAKCQKCTSSLFVTFQCRAWSFFKIERGQQQRSLNAKSSKSKGPLQHACAAGTDERCIAFFRCVFLLDSMPSIPAWHSGRVLFPGRNGKQQGIGDVRRLSDTRTLPWRPKSMARCPRGAASSELTKTTRHDAC